MERLEPAEQLVTVFGGGGFIGRYVCEYLLKAGVRVRVASRDPRTAHHIQPLGQVGQVGYVRADITNERSVEAAVHGATAVVNLPGVLKGRFEAVHVDGARFVAEATAREGANALVHVSAINADAASQSSYGSSKGRGEEAVRAAFPQATIIRPSLVFGPEDQLTNRFAGMAQLPFLPIVAAQTKFQPVYVRDLGQAIARATLEPLTFGGQTFEIGGPEVMSMRDLHQTILELTGQTPDVVEVPSFAASMLAKFGWLPGAPLTKDQWTMLQQDNVAAQDAKRLEAFGIKPTPLGAVGHEWLGRFHRGGRFAGRRINLTATN
ncbi:complex I NDUFA9 subunit family protein [Sphingomonas piscis]|uniref:Complex I NDUFA9 subunit family protein n=1 Tax=Sphingomonas piscis TaxID=2714943 RepID=A0A6G7YNR2_9SPHN|nr:complex I NDUFA9 subunit family protein [Sphingomonas piscis]QIK78383.1 complex I NDUFA9 subunit family protein [Sphingomonas piscis]